VTTPTIPGPFHRYVALGDSQSEGVGDDPYPDGCPRGWADRFAGRLAAAQPGLVYANLAVRGRRIADVLDQQLAPALALEPDLVSLIAGVNDLIRPRFDLDTGLRQLDEMHRALRATGATVVTTTLPDPASVLPAARLLRSRVAGLNAGVRDIAVRHGCLVLDGDAVARLADRRMWCDDRLHFSPAGHRALASAMAALLGVPGEADGAESPTPAGGRSLGDELRWARTFLVPWIGRRLTGRSSGDGRGPKRPQLEPVRFADAAEPAA
jgi:lysophospholipase L1-like esterase